MNTQPKPISAAYEHGDPKQAGKWRTHSGRFVPEQNISQYDKRKEEVLLPIIREAAQISDKLKLFKQWAFQNWCDFDVESAEDYGVEILTEKGNGTAYSFDQRFKVQMNSSTILEFDSRLKPAIELIKECIRDWAQHSDPNLLAVVEAALEQDSKGTINVRRVLGLRRMQVSDERWATAMQAIADATLEVSRTAYLNVYERIEKAPGRFEWQLIPLSLAKA